MGIDKPENIKRLEKFIDNIIRFSEEKHLSLFDISSNFEKKLNYIERLIEILKFYNGYTVNNIKLFEVINSGFDIEKNFISIGSENAVKFKVKDPLKPYQIELPLMMYLFSMQNKRKDILSIIKGFSEEMREYLSILDFETTRTGTVRFFTNTRFAARELRKKGFLKITEKELFKTWELTLLGLLFVIYNVHKIAPESFVDIDLLKHNMYKEAYNRFLKLDYNIKKHIPKEFELIIGFLLDPGFIRHIERFVSKQLNMDVKMIAVEKLISDLKDVILNPDISSSEKRKLCEKLSDEIEKLPDKTKIMESIKNSKFNFKSFMPIFSLFLN